VFTKSWTNRRPPGAGARFDIAESYLLLSNGRGSAALVQPCPVTRFPVLETNPKHWDGFVHGQEMNR
jgi:hypothetical protein